MSAPMMKCKSASLTAHCLKIRAPKSTWIHSMERAGDQTFSLGGARARMRAPSHQCQKRPNVGLFCSLVGLFFLYMRPLLTLMHTSCQRQAGVFCSLVGLFFLYIRPLLTLIHTLGDSLVTSAQADNIGIVSDILRDGCAHLSPPSRDKNVAQVNASYQDIFGKTRTPCIVLQSTAIWRW